MKAGRLVLIFCILPLVARAAPAFASDDLPDHLIGLWESERVERMFVGNQKPPLAFVDDTLAISIRIQGDGAVVGTVGTARLIDAVAERNRGRLGRLLHLKTDFIIRGGRLEGPVAPEDTVQARRITMPFNIVDGEMQGTIMVLQRRQYPGSLVRVRATRSGG